jgi:hypothetical protein
MLQLKPHSPVPGAEVPKVRLRACEVCKVKLRKTSACREGMQGCLLILQPDVLTMEALLLLQELLLLKLLLWGQVRSCSNEECCQNNGTKQSSSSRSHFRDNPQPGSLVFYQWQRIATE